MRALRRPVGVWLVVTTAATAAVGSVPGAWAVARASAGVDRPAGVVVAGCATALSVALGWLWVITTRTVLDVRAGSVPIAAGTTRRLVLTACGVAAVVAAAPAQAADGDGVELLVGLAVPERAVATPGSAPRPGTVHPYVVRPGDSLWSIALAHPGTGDVERRWRAIWAANRDVVGRDPDLILPGQHLHLPGTPPHEHTDEDGER